MDVAFVHNPKAGGKRHSREDIERFLRHEGYHPKYLTIAEVAKRPAALRHGTFVVVAGGDGSIRKVALALAGTGRILAPLPLGTANNIARSLGINGRPKDIIAGWNDGIVRQIDLGVAEGPWGKRTFVEGAGIGLVGKAMPILQAIGDADDHKFDQIEDELHRDLCVYIALTETLPPTKAKIVIDGGAARTGEFVLLECLNISRAGPCIRLQPGADMSDGKLDLISITEEERPLLLKHITAHLSDARPVLLPRAQASKVTLELSQGWFRVDDQLLWQSGPKPGRVRIRLSVLPKALEVMLPRL